MAASTADDSGEGRPPREELSDATVKRVVDGREYDMAPGTATVTVRPRDGGDPVRYECGDLLALIRNGTFYVPRPDDDVRGALETLAGGDA